MNIKTTSAILQHEVMSVPCASDDSSKLETKWLQQCPCMSKLPTKSSMFLVILYIFLNYNKQDQKPIDHNYKRKQILFVGPYSANAWTNRRDPKRIVSTF